MTWDPMRAPANGLLSRQQLDELGVPPLGAPGAPVRVQVAGGGLVANTAHPYTRPFEQLFRKEPPAAAFSVSVSPQSPIAFDLGAFKVAQSEAVLIYNTRPDVYRYTGIGSSDMAPVEPRALSTKIGFDVGLDRVATGVLSYQLIPSEAQVVGVSQRQTSTSDLFRAPKSTFGSGTGTQPQRPERPGAPQVPFTLLGQANQTYTVRCVIFGQLTQSIAFIEYALQGVLVGQQYLEQILKLAQTGGPEMGGF